jgi:hypothetical protein
VNNTDQNITNAQPLAANLLGHSFVISVRVGDLLPEPPRENPGITVPLDKPDDPVPAPTRSFSDALALALAQGKTNETAAFWQWLERAIVNGLESFGPEEIPYALQAFSLRH